jgi:adsorption protein B
MQDGKPFAGNSMTEDYEVGLRMGALGLKTMFVRIPAQPGDRGVVASRGHFPPTLGSAVRQKARWLGGIALSGWDRLGWSGGLAERWMRMRDRRGPLAALLLLAAYSAALIWSQIWLAEALGAPIDVKIDPTLVTLLIINGWLLAWRVLMRACFTASAYGFTQGLLSIPRMVVGNVIAMLAAARAVSLHLGGGAKRWDKTRHIFPAVLPR